MGTRERCKTNSQISTLQLEVCFLPIIPFFLIWPVAFDPKHWSLHARPSWNSHLGHNNTLSFCPSIGFCPHSDLLACALLPETSRTCLSSFLKSLCWNHASRRVFLLGQGQMSSAHSLSCDQTGGMCSASKSIT